MIIFGLGNPGEKYKFTRHNAGYLFLDYTLGTEFIQSNSGFKYLKRGQIVGIKSDQFMNLSGIVFPHVIKRFNDFLPQIVLAYDDIDLPVGEFRVRTNKSSGGHHGVESFEEFLNLTDVLRVRIGVGRPEYSGQVADYVLSNFTDEELKLVQDAFTKAKALLLDFKNS